MDADMLKLPVSLEKCSRIGIKYTRCNILKGTPLEQLWEKRERPLSMAEVCVITAAQLALPAAGNGYRAKTETVQRIVPQRRFGSLDKLVRNVAIAQHLKRTDSWQGKYFQ